MASLQGYLHAGRKWERRLGTMHARMSTLEGPADRMDEGLRQVREHALPQLQQQDGFKGFVALGDRQSGKLIGISFWESEEAMRAAEEVGDRTRRESAEAMGDTIEGVDRFEVGLFEVPSAGPVSGVTDTVGDTVGGGVTATGQTVGGLLGAATGAVTGVTAGAVGAAAEGTERAVEAVAFPIEGYDEMNVDEISTRLNDLSVEELQLVRDYEELNKKRESLLERMDRKIRSA
jgi:heme-degrading monooxygenase HmoA